MSLFALSAISASIRRGGESNLIPWTPEQATTLLWLDGTDGDSLILASSKLSEWMDKSGNENHATQVTDSLRPTVGVLNGEVAPVFIGSFLNIPVLGGTHSTLFFVSNCAVKENISLAGASNDTYLPIAASSGGLNTDTLRVNGISNPAGSSILVNGEASQTITDRAGIHQELVANAPTLTVFDNIPNISTGWVIGRGSTSSWYWNGEIAEVIAAPAPLDLTTRQKIEGYLAHKWGLTGKLPTNHPYKTSQPVQSPAP